MYNYSLTGMFSTFYQSAAYVFTKIKMGTIGDIYELYMYKEKFIFNDLVDRAKNTNIGIAYAGPTWYSKTPKIVVVMGNKDNIEQVADYGELNDGQFDPKARADFDIVDKIAGHTTIIRLQGPEAKNHKKIMTRFLNGSKSINYSLTIAEKRFHDLMLNWDTAISFQTYFSYLTANIIGECVLSIPEFDIKDIPFIRTVSDLITQPNPSQNDIKDANEKIAQLSYNLLDKYRKEILSNDNYISNLNQTKEKDLSDTTINEIYEQNKVAIVYIVENNLSNSLMMALVQIHQTPEIKARLIKEFLNNNIQSNYDSSILDAKQFPYLDAVVRETLRFLSPGAVITRQTSRLATLNIRDPNDNIKQYSLPAHSRMFVPFNHIHHASFWKNGDQFDPERFLPENLPQNCKENYMPFSTGKRACPAIFFAPALMKIGIFMSLFYEFTFSHSLNEIKLISRSTAPHWDKELFLKNTPKKIADDLTKIPISVNRSASIVFNNAYQ